MQAATAAYGPLTKIEVILHPLHLSYRSRANPQSMFPSFSIMKSGDGASSLEHPHRHNISSDIMRVTQRTVAPSPPGDRIPASAPLTRRIAH